MRKIRIELVIISVLWIVATLSFLITKRTETPYLVGIISLLAISASYKKFPFYCLIGLFVALILAVFNIIRFTLVFNVYISVFNVMPLILLIILSYKRRKAFRI